MSSKEHQKAMDELKKIAEKKMGMSWDQIMKQADEDDAKQKKLKDPIAEAQRKSSVSPKKMLKNSLTHLDKLMSKKNKPKDFGIFEKSLWN